MWPPIVILAMAPTLEYHSRPYAQSEPYAATWIGPQAEQGAGLYLHQVSLRQQVGWLPVSRLSAAYQL